MKLYHCQTSRSMRTRWALEEMGLDYELEVLPFPPRVFAKHYKDVNPLGTVPTLIDGATMITESSAACQYLADTYGPTELAVAPGDQHYGAYLNWMYRSDATLTFPLTITFRYLQLEPEERRLPQAAEDYKKWFLGRWTCVTDAFEDGRKYLCADRFTMADICVSYAYYFSQLLNVEEAATPQVKAWWARLEERDAYQQAISV